MSSQAGRLGGGSPGPVVDEDVKPGAEPGASRQQSMLVSTDSFEDLSACLEEQLALANSEQGTTTTTTLHPSPIRGKLKPAGSIKRLRQESLEKEIDGIANNFVNSVNDNDAVQDDTFADKPVNSTAPSLNRAKILSENHVTPEDDFHVADVSQLEPLDRPVESPTHLQHEEEVDTASWKAHKKHIFIMSEAGKPIYSRYGSEDKLVTLSGVMQALVSLVQDTQDLLRCIIAGPHKFVFLLRRPIILVAVCRSRESTAQLLLHLTYVYNQVISVLTSSQLDRIFEQRRNYDLRRLLTGAEKFIDNLLHLMDTDPSVLLGAVRCLPLTAQVRDTIGQTIVQNAKVKDLVFAILVAKNQLITLVRMKRYFIHPADLHLILNLVSASTSFQAAESWTPICLPKFDSSGFLYAHVSYLDEQCPACLLMLTVNREMFFTLSECKQKILDKLMKQQCLMAIRQSLANETYRIGQVGIADLRHFIYKSKSTAQYTSPQLESPYVLEEEKDRLFGLYHFIHNRVHNSARPLKICFHVASQETILGWVTSGFELYATFGPLVTKPTAISAINKLLRWIKKEEDRLFILNSPTF